MTVWMTKRGTDLLMKIGSAMTIIHKLEPIVTDWIMCLIQAAVFGILLTGVWYLLKKWWVKNSDARFVYTSLRTVVLAFAIPAVYIGRSLYNRYYLHSGDIGDTTNAVAIVCGILWVIWFGGAVRLFWQYRMESSDI